MNGSGRAGRFPEESAIFPLARGMAEMTISPPARGTVEGTTSPKTPVNPSSDKQQRGAGTSRLLGVSACLKFSVAHLEQSDDIRQPPGATREFDHEKYY
jgi:hypothetical protein